MKIRPVTEETLPKALALLKRSSTANGYEDKLVADLHQHQRQIYDWVVIIRNKVEAYIAFTRAYDGSEVCGFHLGPLAVSPQMQNQGLRAELMSFAMRQKMIKDETVFVRGEPKFYKGFGFKPCSIPKCHFAKKGDHFQAVRNQFSNQFTVGYEPEFRG